MNGFGAIRKNFEHGKEVISEILQLELSRKVFKVGKWFQIITWLYLLKAFLFNPSKYMTKIQRY